jgi:DnaK suppressor protein
MKELIMTKAMKNKYYYINSEDTLSKEELLFFKKELEEKKEKIQKNLDIASTELNASTKDCQKDEADHAIQAVENSTNNAILQEQHKTLNQINRSLNRIAMGTYGICHLCEEVIDIERLKVKIFAEYCVSCREVIEKQR